MENESGKNGSTLSKCDELIRTPEIRKMALYVRDRLYSPEAHGEANRFYFRDRYTHTLRVLGWACRLLAELPGDEYAIVVAALFHDAGYDYTNAREHARQSAILCREYLRNIDIDNIKKDKIVELVAGHSHKEIPDYALSSDMKILMDADLLDELGMTIVLWDSMGEGSRREGSYYSTMNRISYAYGKLTNVRRYIKTDVGARYYDEGLDVLKNALERMRFELQPEIVGLFDENGQLDEDYCRPVAEAQTPIVPPNENTGSGSSGVKSR